MLFASHPMLKSTSYKGERLELEPVSTHDSKAVTQRKVLPRSGMCSFVIPEAPECYSRLTLPLLLLLLLVLLLLLSLLTAAASSGSRSGGSSSGSSSSDIVPASSTGRAIDTATGIQTKNRARRNVCRTFQMKGRAFM